MSEQQHRNEASRSFRKRHIMAPACFLIVVAGAYGFYTYATAASGPRTWSRTAESAAEFENDPEWQEEAERLEALGYLGGWVPVPDQVGVTIHRPAAGTLATSIPSSVLSTPPASSITSASPTR